MAKRQKNPEITWSNISEETYWEQLGVLPPAQHRHGWFLMGEEMGGYYPEYTYLAYRWLNGDKFQKANRPITIKEFNNALDKYLSANKGTNRKSNPRYLISRDGVEVGYYPGFTSVEAIKRAKIHYGAGKYTAEKVDSSMYLGRGAERTQARERRERQEAHHAERMEMAKGRNPGMDVAHIIYQQLGGARFAQMTGAKNFLGDKNSLRFKLPKNQSQANLVTITLEANDTYTISFAQYRGNNVKVLKEIDMVYADQLREIFERYTGLYTSLGTMKHRPNGHWRNGTHIHAEKIDHLDVAKVHNLEDEDYSESSFNRLRYKFIFIPVPGDTESSVYPIETEEEIYEAQEAMKHAGLNTVSVMEYDNGEIIPTSLTLWQD